MPKKRRPHDELRPALLAAARDALEQGGLAALSARGLAQAVDVSVGTLYNLFGHLDGVVRAMNLESMGILQDELKAALAGSNDTTEAKLLAMADAYFDFAFGSPHRWEALFRYHSETPREAELDTAQEGLFEILRNVAGADIPDEALNALWASVHGVVELAMAQRSRDPSGQAARRQAKLVVMASLRGFEVMRARGELDGLTS